MRRPLSDRAGLLGLILLGLALRAPGLVDRPLWLDEAVTWQVAAAEEPWRMSAEADLQPPWAALLARPAAAAVPWSVRLPSFVASVVSIPLAFLAGRIVGAPMALAALAAAHPALVAYGREGRPYALAAAGLWLLLAVPTGRWAALAALVASPWTWTSAPLVAAIGVARRQPAVAAVAVAVGVAGLPMAWVQWARRGAEHAARHDLPAGAWEVVTGLGRLLGWAATGLRLPDAWALGGLVVLPLVWRSEVVAALAAGVALAVGGAAPLDAGRHLLPTLVVLLWAAAPRLPRRALWCVVAAWVVVGVVRHPGVPVQDVAGLCRRLPPGASIVVDGSATPAWRAAGCPRADLRDVATVPTSIPPGWWWVGAGDAVAAVPSWGERLEATGAMAWRRTMWVSPGDDATVRDAPAAGSSPRSPTSGPTATPPRRAR